MAKLPGYIVVTGQSVEGNRAYVHFRVRTWHPRFLLLCWGMAKNLCRQQGVNPYSPKVLIAFGRFLLRIM